MLYASASSSSSSGSSNFIIPNATFIVELIIFVIVLGIVAKFILPPLQAALDERERKVKEGVSASDSARAEASRLDKERLSSLAEARGSARSLLEDAQSTVDGLVADARARGQQEHDRRVGEAQAAIETERQRIHADLMQRAESLVVAAAERIVGGGLDASRHRGLIAAELAEADASRPGERG